VSLTVPVQEVEPAGDGRYQLRYEVPASVEDWNAQISLLTGMCAAAMMIEHGVGVLRTLPAPDRHAVGALRRTARALGIEWADGTSPAQLLAGLPLSTPRALALRRAATGLLRGAGYAVFDRTAGTAPPADPGHGGIGAPYAHVTAPLRRLVDRFGSEVCLALAAGQEVPAPLRAAPTTLPSTMAASDALAGRVGRACVDRTEAALLADRVGQVVQGVVLRAAGPDGEPGEVYLPEPPVLARCSGALRPGDTAMIRVVAADPGAGRIELTAAG